jgi:hypothetical protein
MEADHHHSQIIVCPFQSQGLDKRRHSSMGFQILRVQLNMGKLLKNDIFLAHLAKGNVSFCHHLSSVVC